MQVMLSDRRKLPDLSELKVTNHMNREAIQQVRKEKKKKKKDYAFRHQFNEKPSIIPGCPGSAGEHVARASESCWAQLLLVTTAEAWFVDSCCTGFGARQACGT